MWIIVLAAFQFLDLRTSGWIVLIRLALIVMVLIAFCMILGIVPGSIQGYRRAPQRATVADSTANGDP